VVALSPWLFLKRGTCTAGAGRLMVAWVGLLDLAL